MDKSDKQNILFLRHGFAGSAAQTADSFGIDDKHVSVHSGRHVSQIGQTLNKLIGAYITNQLLANEAPIERLIHSREQRAMETAQDCFPELNAEIDNRIHPARQGEIEIQTEEIKLLLQELRQGRKNTAIITHDIVPFLAGYITSNPQANFTEENLVTYCDDNFNLQEARNSGGVLLQYEGDRVKLTHIHPQSIIKQLLQEGIASLPNDPPSPFAAPLKKLVSKTDDYAFQNFSPYYGAKSDSYNALTRLAERLGDENACPLEGLLSNPDIRKHFRNFLSQAAEMGQSALAEKQKSPDGIK